ncbi:hypothetical protein [Saccharomonospora piscinae]|uniref:hypothetical protein n=1 Tax=Saccharomonospora piscinae TaxID=687388 RepID=UPI000466C70C|nr:hypothetical protein [Saccharomonospora piscinae]
MSEIRMVIEQLNAAAARVDEVAGLLHSAESRVDDMRQSLFRVLADSQAPEVGHAHQVTAHTAELVTTATHALHEAAALARHRAASL